MSDVVIRVENLSKRYRIGQREQYQALRDVLTYWMSAPWRYLRAMDRHKASTDGQPATADDVIWALRDVSFEIRQGEVIGIIGRNGAGKSTLLKILSRITKPTNGSAKIRGRVGSLLEVGTGFHPELTGRENIYLNGAVLGMKRAEIERKFDEIVAFAELEKFIDTPVKRYSSGMYMRLAFAVAAHLEPEILVVDEVLAVGDADFQKKCLGRMGDISKEGRTVLFVSHNMDAIQRLCSRCAYLEQGRLVRYEDTNEVIQHYLEQKPGQVSPGEWFDLSNAGRRGTGEVRFIAAQYQSPRREVRYNPYSDGPLEFALILKSDASRSLGSLAVTLYTRLGTKLVNADTVTLGQAILLQKGLNLVRIRIEKLHLNPGIYTVGLWASPISYAAFDFIEAAFDIEVIQKESRGYGVRVKSDGTVTCHMELLEVSHTVDLPVTRENSLP